MSRLSLYANDRGQCVMHYSGFSILAGIALFIWALHRRLYLFSVIALALEIIYGALVVQLSDNVQLVLFAVQFVVLGSVANRIHLYLLNRRGWLLTDQEHPAGSEAT